MLTCSFRGCRSPSLQNVCQKDFEDKEKKGQWRSPWEFVALLPFPAQKVLLTLPCGVLDVDSVSRCLVFQVSQHLQMLGEGYLLIFNVGPTALHFVAIPWLCWKQIWKVTGQPSKPALVLQLWKVWGQPLHLAKPLHIWTCIFNDFSASKVLWRKTCVSQPFSELLL